MFVFFNQILPRADMLSGGERIVVELLKREDNLTVALPNRRGWLVMKELPANYRFTRIPFNSNNNILIFLNWLILAVRSLRFRIDEDICSSGDYLCDTLPAYFLKGKHTWGVYIFHLIPLKKGRLISWIMQRLSLILIKRKADQIIVFNEMMKEYLLRKGFQWNTLFVQEVGIDEEAIKKVKVNGKCYDGCFMGRLSPSKGIFCLSEIWHKQTGKLLVIGRGGFSEDVKRFKQKCGENIIFAGHKEGEEKYRLIKQSKVFIFPSYEEGLSLTIKEVLACGVPIIAWDLPVYKALYGDKLITVPIGDIEKFREKVKEILCIS